MMFGSKLLGSFLISAIYSTLKQRQAVVTLTVYNPDLDRLGTIYFLDPSPLLFGFHPHFGNHWLGSTNQPLCLAAATSSLFLYFSSEPWW